MRTSGIPLAVTVAVVTSKRMKKNGAHFVEPRVEGSCEGYSLAPGHSQVLSAAYQVKILEHHVKAWSSN